jgi:hypothetical protein
MSKAYIPSVVFVAATGTGIVESSLTGPLFSAWAHAPVPASNKAAAATSAVPQYFLIKACEILCFLSTSSSHLVWFANGTS